MFIVFFTSKELFYDISFRANVLWRLMNNENELNLMLD